MNWLIKSIMNRVGMYFHSINIHNASSLNAFKLQLMPITANFSYCQKFYSRWQLVPVPEKREGSENERVPFSPKFGPDYKINFKKLLELPTPPSLDFWLHCCLVLNFCVVKLFSCKWNCCSLLDLCAFQGKSWL